MKKIVWNPLFIFLFLAVSACSAVAQPLRQITDAGLRIVNIPQKIDRIICSGPGCLRLITYFDAQDLVVAVDSIEARNNKFDARPYSLANPQFKKLPIFGEFRGHDDPEKILGLKNSPQVIFKTYATMGYDPVELEDRTKDIAERKTCFIGGIAFKGPHGFQSTEPAYPPFTFINAKNIASIKDQTGKNFHHSNFSKEKILQADPDILFLDLSTLQMGEGHGGLHELKNDPVYKGLTAVKTNKVYGVLPYNWYTQNFGSILADAWYIGKILYPGKFVDIDPGKKSR